NLLNMLAEQWPTARLRCDAPTAPEVQPLALVVLPDHGRLAGFEYYAPVVGSFWLFEPPLTKRKRIALTVPTDLPVGIAVDEVRFGLEHWYQRAFVKFTRHPFENSAFSAHVADHGVALVHCRKCNSCVATSRGNLATDAGYKLALGDSLLYRHCRWNVCLRNFRSRINVRLLFGFCCAWRGFVPQLPCPSKSCPHSVEINPDR